MAQPDLDLARVVSAMDIAGDAGLRELWRELDGQSPDFAQQLHAALEKAINEIESLESTGSGAAGAISEVARRPGDSGVAATVAARIAIRPPPPIAAIHAGRKTDAAGTGSIMVAKDMPPGPEPKAARIAEHWMEKYGRAIPSLDADDIAAVRHAFDDAAAGFVDAGCNDARSADRMLRKILSRDNRVRAIIGGSLAVGVGCSISVWMTNRCITPHLREATSPAMRGFVNGWILFVIDKLVATGFGAVAAKNMYGSDPDPLARPAIMSNRMKTAMKAGIVNATATASKNMVARGSLLQSAVPQRARALLLDVVGDTAGSFVSGGLGKYFTYRLVNKHPQAAFLMQEDVREKIAAFCGQTPSEALGKKIADNARTFADAAARATMLPSNYIAGMYYALLFAGLISAQEHIFARSGNGEDKIGRNEALLRALATAGITGAMSFGTSIITTIGVLDSYQPKIVARAGSAIKWLAARAPRLRYSPATPDPIKQTE